MSTEVIQAHYGQLQTIARRFGESADVQANLQQQVRQRVEQLRTSGYGKAWPRPCSLRR